MSDNPKAYLSYSAADEAVVRRLRRRLQRFVIPRALRDGGGARLGRFAPDEKIQPGSEAMRQALADAEWLIVWCSPASAVSEQVNTEIDTFIRVNSGGRLLLALLSGDPPQALPQRLRGREPVTADFRPSADGEELGVLKLVATLINANPGALRDRLAVSERAGSALRTAAMAALAATTLAGAGAALYAAQERTRAEDMAAAAVNLGADLVAQAAGAAPSAADADPLAAAEAQFERLFADGPHNVRLETRRAQLMAQFAELYARRNDTEGARERALAAISVFERLPEKQRGSLDYAAVLLIASRAEEAAGRGDEAISLASRAAQAASGASEGASGDAARRQRAAYASALSRLGELYIQASRPSEAKAHLAQAIPALEAALEDAPSDQGARDNLARGLARLGDVQALTDDKVGARASYERASAMQRARVQQAPGDAAARGMLGDTLMKLAQVLVEGDAVGAARAPLEESLAIARAQAAAAPGDAAFAQILADRVIATAQAQALLGDPNEATLSEAIVAARTRAQARGAGLEARAAYAGLLVSNAERLERARKFEDARAAWRETAEAQRALRAAQSDAPTATTALAETLEHVGLASQRLDDRSAAVAAYAEAVRLRRAVVAAAPGDKPARFSLASSLYTLAQARQRAANEAGARSAFEEAARLRAALAAEDPSDQAAAALALESLRQVTQIQRAANNSDGVRRTLQVTRDLLTRLAAAEPQNARYAASLRRTEAALQETQQD